MWHASVCDPHRRTSAAGLFDRALDELDGVGDAALGEWREVGDIAVHVRRRLSVEEQATVGPVADIRGTWEATKRINRVRRYMQLPARDWPAERLP